MPIGVPICHLFSKWRYFQFLSFSIGVNISKFWEYFPEYLSNSKNLSRKTKNLNFDICLFLLACYKSLINFSYLSCARKMKFSIKDFFSKYDQIRRKLQILSYLLKKSLMENFIFCAVYHVHQKSSWKSIYHVSWLKNYFRNNSTQKHSHKKRKET